MKQKRGRPGTRKGSKEKGLGGPRAKKAPGLGIRRGQVVSLGLALEGRLDKGKKPSKIPEKKNKKGQEPRHVYGGNGEIWQWMTLKGSVN